jgi:DNA-binding Lrp family transcriptional regulator
MSDNELILNFVNQYSKPFDAETIAKFTNLSTTTVTDRLPKLLEDQSIKQIEDNPRIYVKANRFQARIGYQHYKGWTFNLADAHKLLDILEQGRYKSIREIAHVIGKSRQWVYIYLEALASIEVVDLRQFMYVVISRKNVPKIGRKIQKCVLKMLWKINRLGLHRIIE